MISEAIIKFRVKARKSRIFRGGLSSLLIKLGSIPLGFLIAVMLARSLGAAGYGLYAYALAFTSMIAIPAKIGLPQVVLRETAKNNANERYSIVRGLWRWSTGVGLLASAIAILAAYLVFKKMGLAKDESELKVFSLAAFCIPLIVLANLRSAALRGLHEVVKSQIPEAIIRPLGIVFLVGIMLLMGFELSPLGAMSIYVFTALIAFIGGAYLLRRSMTEVLKSERDREYHAKAWLSSALPLAMVGSMTYINQHADIIIIGYFFERGEVGIYKITVLISGLIIIGQQAAIMVCSSYFASFYAAGEMDKMKRLASFASLASFGIAAIGACFLFILGKQFLGFVFGPEYIYGYTAMAILVGAQLFNSAMGPLGALLAMARKEAIVAKIVTFVAALNIVLNFLLIPPFGIEGAATATAISLMASNVLLSRAVSSNLGFRVGVLGFMEIKRNKK